MEALGRHTEFVQAKVRLMDTNTGKLHNEMYTDMAGFTVKQMCNMYNLKNYVVLEMTPYFTKQQLN